MPVQCSGLWSSSHSVHVEMVSPSTETNRNEASTLVSCLSVQASKRAPNKAHTNLKFRNECPEEGVLSLDERSISV